MRGLSGLLLCGILLLSISTVDAAPEAKLWPYWRGYSAASDLSIDHSPWDVFLGRYLVSGSGSEPNRLRYAAVSAEDRQQLEDYLNMLEKVRPTEMNRGEQLAYWINLYNALTVQVVLEHYPIATIREINSGWFRSGPWDLKLTEVEGFELTLNDIEHRILRPIWQDSRIHYALNCASYSCPDLQAFAYTHANSEELLDRGARAYVNSERGVHFDGGKLILSRIYDWYQDDFSADKEGLLSYLQSLAEPDLAQQFASYSGAVDYAYDWRLNEKRR
jgi:hypothetical protein